MSNWIEVRATFAHTPEDWSPAIEIFDCHGCPETLQEDDPPALVSYYEAVSGVEDRIEALRQSLSALDLERFETVVVVEQDWAENWKQFFKTRKVDGIVIRPSWEEYKAEPGEIVIDLDPGQAFGTGDHPTTRLCLSLMQSLSLEGLRVADVGCGSGILAIAAVKLGAKEVIASDIDEQSAAIAKQNAERNGVEIEVRAEADLQALGGKFDVVVSNIITATLVRLAPDFYEMLEPARAFTPAARRRRQEQSPVVEEQENEDLTMTQDRENLSDTSDRERAASSKARSGSRTLNFGGLWIVSGIIHDNWQNMKEAAERVGFSLAEKEEEDEWVGATFRR